MSGQIFISYRREESRWSAKSVHFRLCRDFTPDQIFMDIDSVGLGEDFVKAIETTVEKCHVLIAVIGYTPPQQQPAADYTQLSSKPTQGGERQGSAIRG